MDNFDLRKYLAEGRLFKKILNENQASDLINNGVVLYVSDDSKLAPGFIEPKKIGFIIHNSTIDTLPKNPEIAQLFNDNYGIIDRNYITTFFTNSNHWETITTEDELDNFMSKYNKIYLINPNGKISLLSGEKGRSKSYKFNEFLDTDEGGYMRVYIDGVAEERGLDLNRNQEFDEAFKLALSKLKKEQPQLDFKAIMVNKESFR